MIHLQQQHGGCDTLQALTSLEEMLDETLRITEKILSQEPVPFPGLDSWNEEIEAENYFHTEKLSDLFKEFKKNEQIIDSGPNMEGWKLLDTK